MIMSFTEMESSDKTNHQLEAESQINKNQFLTVTKRKIDAILILCQLIKSYIF